MTKWKTSGLTAAEVRRRRELGQDNRAVKPPMKTIPQIFASNIFTYFNAVFLIIAVILLLVQSYRDLTFLPVIIANTVIGIVQELRARRVLGKLTVLHSPKAQVLRVGEERTVPVEDLVLDDAIILKAGAQIPADAEVMEGEVLVNEALLTGEEDEIRKRKGKELMSGSFVVSGECVARLTKVGADSYAARLTLQAKEMAGGEQSEILRSLNKFVKIVGVAIIPLAVIMFVQQFIFQGTPLQQTVQSFTAAVIGMIPEGLFLLASVTLVISAMRLASQQVLLHDMKSIETLARADVLCVDKTGTITENTMTVAEVVPDGVTGRELKNLLADYAAASAADNATMQALQAEFKRVRSRQKILRVIPFSSRAKYSGVEFVDGLYLLGAPEILLGEGYDDAKVARQVAEGGRVLVLVRASRADYRVGDKVEQLGFVVLRNKVRATAAATFRYFVEQGVEVKVISGDNAAAVARIAEQVGIKGHEHYVDVSKLGEAELRAATTKYTVFGRVKPEQKRQIVQALKSAGHTVAMTGDGVNDVLALKDADASVAMASGSDAAVQAAQMVLLDSDFSRMPAVVGEGRRVVNNLERSGSLFLVKNIFSFLMMTLAILFSVTYPLVPAQVSLVTMFTIGIPSFLLAQIPNRNLIRGSFVGNVLKKAIPGGLTDVILVGATLIVGMWLGLNGESLGTACTLTFGAVGVVFLLRICWPFDRWKAIIWIGMILGLALTITFLPWLFAIMTDIPMMVWLLVAVMAVVAIPLMMGLDRVIIKIWEKIEKRRKNYQKVQS